MEKKQVINHPAVWVAVVLSQIIPWIWYRLFQFTPLYANLRETIKETPNAPALYIIGFMASIVAMYLLEWLFTRIEADSAQEGLVAGLVIGVVFNIFSLITIYSFTSSPIEIGLIDFGTNALVFAFAGLVLGAWRKYEPA